MEEKSRPDPRGPNRKSVVKPMLGCRDLIAAKLVRPTLLDTIHPLFLESAHLVNPYSTAPIAAHASCLSISNAYRLYNALFEKQAFAAALHGIQFHASKLLKCRIRLFKVPPNNARIEEMKSWTRMNSIIPSCGSAASS